MTGRQSSTFGPAQIAADDDVVIGRPLHQLASLILRDLARGKRAGLPYFISAGRTLLEAKRQLPHGEFQGWVEKNIGKSYRQAWAYMKLAEAARQPEKFAAANVSTLGQFLEARSAQAVYGSSRSSSSLMSRTSIG